MLQTTSLLYDYHNGPSLSFPDLHAQVDEPLLILGQSGVGKTTLLHLLAGLIRPLSGKIVVGGTDMTQLSTSQLDHFRGKHIGLVFQQAHFNQALSVGQNLQMAQYLAGKKQDKHQIRELLNRLGLGDKMEKSAYRLSLGEQQRVSIARAVLNRPQLLLADEPTSALDDSSTAEVINLLQESAKEAGSALVIVTHDKRLKDQMSNQVELKRSTQVIS